MSAHTAETPVLLHSIDVLSPLRRLWDACLIQAGPVKTLGKLSDHLLLDIGVDPRSLRDPAGSDADRLYLMLHGFSRP